MDENTKQQLVDAMLAGRDMNEHMVGAVEVVRGKTNARVTKWSFICAECHPQGKVNLCNPTTKDAATRQARAHYDGHRVKVAS